MAGGLVAFTESQFSPWGKQSRGSSLPDATNKYYSCIGSIPGVNKSLSERGLHYPSHCPPRLPALVPQPLTASLMAHKQRKKPRGKSLSESDGLPPPSEESKLVELASFPGYDPDHLTPLPHALSTLEQMQRTQRAQTMLASKREGFRETWKLLFYSSSSQALFQDYFWWFFLHKYQNSKLLSVQYQLFNRISASYVGLLCMDADTRWKDPFFKTYPDLVAQCVYSTFVHAYPASWNSFDANFRSSLITMISLWTVGTRPLCTAWKKWNFDVLEPTNHLKHLSEEKSDQDLTGKPIKKDAFELDALLKQCEEELIPQDESVESKPSRHISLKNFDSVLATSMATNSLRISPSKEELVKSQAQATRDMTTSVTRVHEPCIRSPEKMVSAQFSNDPRHVSMAVPSGSGAQDEYINYNLGTLCTDEDVEIFITHDDMPQEQRDEMERIVKFSSPDKKKVLIHAKEKFDTIEEFMARQPEFISLPVSTSQSGPHQKTSSGPQKAASVPQITSSKKSQISSQKTVSSPLKTTASCAPAINTKPPTQDTVFKKPSSPLPHRKKLAAQASASEAPPLPPKRSKAPPLPPKRSKAPPLPPKRSKAPAPPGQRELWEQSVISKFQAKLKSTDPPTSQKPPKAREEKASNPQCRGVQARLKPPKSKPGAEAAKKTEKGKEAQVPVPVAPCGFEHVQFDTAGHSPLVKHFLEQRQLSRENETKVLTGRTELAEDSQSSSVSFQDILCEAMERAVQIYEKIEEVYQSSKRNMAKAHKERIKVSQRNEEELKLVLTAKAEVKQLSNVLTTYILNENEPSQRREQVAGAIDSIVAQLNEIQHTAAP